MKIGDILSGTIRNVTFHKEERMIQGCSYGNYSSCYIAHLIEFNKGIVIIDKLVELMHPNWQNKTANRAVKLSDELRDKEIKFKVTNMVDNDHFEGEPIYY